MLIVSYIETDADHPWATGEGSPSDPIQVIAQKMYLWPLKVAWHSPEGKCQILMVLSADPDTSVSLSPGLKATESTILLPCRLSVTLKRTPTTRGRPVTGHWP